MFLVGTGVLDGPLSYNCIAEYKRKTEKRGQKRTSHKDDKKQVSPPAFYHCLFSSICNSTPNGRVF